MGGIVTPTPANDGKTHINIYSKGKTHLGRKLSNFFSRWVEINGLRFKSLEAYWYWLHISHEAPEAVCKNLRGHSGPDAKKVGRVLRDRYNCHYSFERIQVMMGKAFCRKVASDNLLETGLRESTLPFMHYYWSGNTHAPIIQHVPQHFWTAQAWEIIRAGLQQGHSIETIEYNWEELWEGRPRLTT